MRRVLMIGLDGFELSLAKRMISEGHLPHLRQLWERSARFLLDHGEAKYSGLAWEHVSAGLSPQDGGRASAVQFDPDTYEVRQPAAGARPFLADLPVRAVSFDLPYCDLSQAPNVHGVSGWGVHDPGVAAGSRPAELLEELNERFGPYPATEWIYGFSWPSVSRTRELGDALERATKARAQAARWLLGERLPEWELGIVVAGEPHSAAEPLWHGADPGHPLHLIDSAATSLEALHRVYAAVDDLVGSLTDAVPDAVALIFAMHGMGSNEADLPAMALLPELLYRRAFGRPHMRPGRWPGELESGIPLLAADESWDQAMQRLVPGGRRRTRLAGALRGLGLGARRRPAGALGWMPAARYQRFWRRMPAFALPSYYDGRIRINLAGREAAGCVEPGEYRTTCNELAELLAACRDPTTGRAILDEVRVAYTDPFEIGPWDADLQVRFRPGVVGFSHPRHGVIGPLPYRRTGGHTGDWGFLCACGPGIPAGNRGAASSFDVVPTAIDLLGLRHPGQVSGGSLVEGLRVAT